MGDVSSLAMEVCAAGEMGLDSNKDWQLLRGHVLCAMGHASIGSPGFLTLRALPSN